MARSNIDEVNRLLYEEDSASSDDDNLAGLTNTRRDVESLLASTKDLEKPSGADMKRVSTNSQ